MIKVKTLIINSPSYTILKNNNTDTHLSTYFLTILIYYMSNKKIYFIDELNFTVNNISITKYKPSPFGHGYYGNITINVTTFDVNKLENVTYNILDEFIVYNNSCDNIGLLNDYLITDTNLKNYHLNKIIKNYIKNNII